MPVEKAKYPVKMMARLLVRIDFSISMLTGTMRPIEKIILKVSIATVGYKVPADVMYGSFGRSEGALSEPREVLRVA